MAFSLREGWDHGPCMAEHRSPVPWTHMHMCGSHCLWTVYVHSGWCVDLHVPASAKGAKTKPKGLHQSQEEKAPNVVTPPLFTLDPS